MARDPLATLIKVRQLACDESQGKLVEALGFEDKARQVCHRIELSIAQETEAATEIYGTDAMVEAFAAWLPEARRQLEAAQQVLLDRQAETMRRRAELTACKTALETVEELQKQRKDEARRVIDMVYARDLEDRPFKPQNSVINAPD